MPETISAPAPSASPSPSAAPAPSPSSPAPSPSKAPQSGGPRFPSADPAPPSAPYDINFDDEPSSPSTDQDTDVQPNKPTTGDPPSKEPGTPSPQTKPGDAAPVGTAVIPDKVKPLREAYEASKAKAAQFEGRVVDLEAKLKAFETSPQGESKVLAEKLTEAEKRVQEYESRIRETDYERSDEYRQTYLKPIEEGYQKLTRAMESWDVTEADGTVRPATEGDFQQLMTMTDRQAKSVARERFGQDAPEVLALRASLVDATTKRQGAMKAFKENAEARHKDMTAKQAQARQAHQQQWDSFNKILVEKNPELFGEGQDADENEALKAGFGIWEKAHGPGQIEPQVRIAHQALVRNSVAFAARAKVRIDKLSSQLKAANDELAKYRGSEPRPGDIHRADTHQDANGYESYEQTLARMG